MAVEMEQAQRLGSPGHHLEEGVDGEGLLVPCGHRRGTDCSTWFLCSVPCRALLITSGQESHLEVVVRSGLVSG